MPENSGAGGWIAALRHDVPASIVVFLVALPLSMGIAIASGVPVEKAAAVGIISGIVGGLLVGLLAGCPLQVTGPAAGMAVIVGQMISDHGLSSLGLILMLAGSVQILAGVFGVGQWFRAVSPAVIQGMLAGIGALIFASQLHVMLDDSPPGTGKKFGGLINFATLPGAIWRDLTQPTEHAPAAIGVLTIVAIVAWTWVIPKRYSFLPAPLFGVVLGTIAAQVMKQFDGRFAEINYIRVAGDLTVAFSLPSWEQAPLLIHGPILLAGLTVAFVASAESLLTATAADAMQQHAPRTKYGQELVAQGIGNMVCGFVGAIPVTGVVVRTGANIQAGAQSRLATILHGVWLLLFVTLLPWVLELIPIASLAAVLVYAGFKLMHPKPVKVLLEYGRSEVAIYVATMATVIVVDLLVGIVVGIVLALGKLLNAFSHLNVRLVTEDGRTILYLEGAATFVRLPRLAAELEKVPPSTELHVHFEGLSYIDHACLDLFMTWEKQHSATGGTLVMDWESLTARFRPHARPSEAAGTPNGELLLVGDTAAVPYKVRTILCPMDLSLHSHYAFQHAGTLAREHGAKLILAHVFPPSDATSETEASMVVSETEKHTIRKKLESMRPLDPRTNLEVCLAEGRAAQEILRLARESEADLIVMGTHGRTGISHLVLGSVAEEVAREARCPVIIVKSAQDGTCST